MAVHKKYNTSTKNNALGRGLDALISTDSVTTSGSSTINEIPISQIEANPNQPRHEFDKEALHELAVSIKEIGIIQPITLRQVASNRFQIIAGERRWRASQLAGLNSLPAYIRTIDDENVMEMALVENIHRQDLNAIEIALAYEHLMEGTGMTQEKVSERVGKSRTAITNYLRLLKLLWFYRKVFIEETTKDIPQFCLINRIREHFPILLLIANHKRILTITQGRDPGRGQCRLCVRGAAQNFYKEYLIRKVAL